MGGPVRRTFSTDEVSKLAGVSRRQLGYWERTGLVVPSSRPSRGRGAARAYAFEDLVECRVVARLLGAGLSLQAVRHAVRELQRLRASERPLAGLSLVSDGRSVFARYGDGWIDALRDGQLVMRFAVGDMADELRGEVERLPAAEAAETARSA